MPIRWLTIFLDVPAQDFARSAAFWCEVTGSGLSPRRGAGGEFATFLPATGDAYLRIQRVCSGPGGCHLDLHVDPGSLGETAGRAVALGARVRHRDDGLVILASPGGFPFRLVQWDGESAVPGHVQLGHGGVSRADQLCLDIPPDAFAGECSFWADLAGWELRPGALPEFAYLERPERMPVRLLLQRREQAAPADRVSGHIDFACTERRGLAQRHAASGARIRSVFPRWVSMADPVGRPYCLTGRDPGTGKLPDTGTT
jgi:hypothetical protein